MCNYFFWKYQDGIYLNHHLVYEALVEQNGRRIRRTSCSGYLKQNPLYFQNGKSRRKQLENTNGVGAFHINTTPQSIQIDCYGTDGKP
jgi:hypothetical protein